MVFLKYDIYQDAKALHIYAYFNWRATVEVFYLIFLEVKSLSEKQTI
jgi:hypothetical protein